MLRLHFAAVIVSSTFALSAAVGQNSAQVTNPSIHGLVKVAEEIKLPAKEPGVLVQLAVREGNLVRAGQVIGKIDDSEPIMQKKAAQAAYNAAFQRWKDDVEIRFAGKAADVAKADYEQMVESNRLATKAIADVEVRAKKLEWDKATLGIEKNMHDRELAKFDAFTKQAELEAAELKIQRRVVTAPFAGVVEDIKRHQDEWVQPGDTILTLLKMDTLYVEGAIEQNKYDPYEIANCEVTVDVEMARGRKAQFKGRIIKVSSLVGGDGNYSVRAEVANQQENGNWLLRDGLPANMTIHLGTGAGAAVSQAR